MPGTVRLHRVLTTKPDKVYRAFIEADAMAKWLPPNGFTCTVHQFDAKVGGAFKMSFRNFTTGMSHSFGGEYLELVPGERLRYTDKFDDPNLPGEMQVTVTLKPVIVGTEVNIVQEGIPDVIPVEMCYLGWQGRCEISPASSSPKSINRRRERIAQNRSRRPRSVARLTNTVRCKIMVSRPRATGTSSRKILARSPTGWGAEAHRFSGVREG